MLRILVLCARDWQHPRAAGVERYAYEVFRRVAERGNYVAWLCQNHGGMPLLGRQAQTLEQSDGIQIARLGARALYRAMAGLFFARMTDSSRVLRQFDVVVDCVEGRPFPISKYTKTPAVPIVFYLSPGLHSSASPPGPVIAPTERAWLDLCNAGVPKRHVIRAPFGHGQCLPDPGDVPDRDELPSMVAFVGAAQPLSRALRHLSRSGHRLASSIYGPVRGVTPQFQGNMIPPTRVPFDRARRAWFAYCGEGFEWRALDFAGSGIPVICPDTPLGREFTGAGETGLLHRPRDTAHLASVVESLLNDETLRRRVAQRASVGSRSATWDRSASLVLAAIENLCQVRVDPPSPVPTT